MDQWDWISYDGLVKKRILHRGISRIHPFDGSFCKIKFIDVSMGNENAFGCPESKTEKDLILGVNETVFERELGRLLHTMVAKEVSLAEIHLKDTKCNVQLELLECKLPLKPLHRLTDDEKIKEAENIKNKATELVKAQRYEDALLLLNRCLKCVVWGKEYRETNFSELYSSVVANMSLCHLKLNNYEKTVDVCTNLLEHRPRHVKCLMRRATAYNYLQDTDKAKHDMLLVLEVEPNNSDAKQILKKILQLKAEQNKSDALRWSKLFKYE